MRCLWITRVDPYPEVSGELIYSGRMIRSFADAGAEVTVLCMARANASGRAQDRAPHDPVTWSIVPGNQAPRWRSVLKPLPNIACRCAGPAMRTAVAEAISRWRWDVVVFDSLSTGWALEPVLSAVPPGLRRPRLVYISHNHEETTRSTVAREFRGNALRRMAMLADARKVARLERRLVAAVDLVTAIAPRDAALYRARRRGRRVIEMSPGYGGRRLQDRRITPDLPRRVVMVGSFDWLAKQANLREFAEAARKTFADDGLDLLVVGDGGAFLESLRSEYPFITFTGGVDDVYPYLDDARMAVVPERLGGGFKLKILDYVFNRLPVAALSRAFDGVPLEHGRSVLVFPDIDRLTRGVCSVIDRVDLLDDLQRHAYDACADQFDWGARGVALRDAVRAL